MAPGPDVRLRWQKLGLVHRPDTSLDWVASSAMNPTPIRLDASTIRVFVGSRDSNGVSRLGWVDVDAADPTRVRGASRVPALDVGTPGTFDDNGVVPTAAARLGDEVRVYYAGYQLLQRVRFQIFTGLAVSDDGGERFRRVQPTPVLDRCPEETQFRHLHTIEREGDGWRAWYAAGSGWNDAGERPTPRYDIRTTTSVDGVEFSGSGRTCVPAGEDDLRISKPAVVAGRSGAHMLFSHERRGTPYRTAYAWSPDGETWHRHDAGAGLDPSPDGWDAEMVVSAALLDVDDQTYVFYNGNGFGADGFGVAVLESAG